MMRNSYARGVGCARLDGRVAKWSTTQLLDAASRSATRAQIALPPRGCVDGRLPPRIAARTIELWSDLLILFSTQ